MKPDADRAADAPEEGTDWTTRAAARVDERRPEATLPRELMLEVYGHARECYPEECCGLIAGPSDGGAERVIRCRNVQSQRQSQGESELGARHAFWMDERELLDALRAIEANGHALKLIYHSHVDTAAYLSNTDVRAALDPEGEPLWPGVGQLVVSVRDGRVGEAGLFEWDPGEHGFVGRPLREAR